MMVAQKRMVIVNILADSEYFALCISIQMGNYTPQICKQRFKMEANTTQQPCQMVAKKNTEKLKK